MPRRRSRRAHASTTVHAALPLRLVTRTDGDGEPQVHLEVAPEPTDRTIQRPESAVKRAG